MINIKLCIEQYAYQEMHQVPFLEVKYTNFMLDGRVPSRYFLLEGTVLSRYFLLDSTVPASNHYLIGHLILLGGRRGGDVLLNILFGLCLYTKKQLLGLL